MRRAAVVVAAVCIVMAGGCGTSSKSDSSASLGSAPFTGHGSIGEAYAVGATPGEHLVVVDLPGKTWVRVSSTSSAG